MHTAQTTFNPDSESFRMGPAAQRTIVPGLVLAVVGTVLAAAFGLRDEASRSMFFHAYLVAFLFYLTITLGALFFVVLHHLARAGWSVTLRRLAESLSANMMLLALLFLPVLFGMGHIYEWWSPKANEAKVSATSEGKAVANVESSGHEGAAGGEGYRGLAGKKYWLKPQWFIFRFCVYFLVWISLASYFRNQSMRQDSSGDVWRSTAMERISAPGMILFALTLTGAAVDLIMSLNPDWATTMLGVYFFADSILSGFVVITLLALWLQANGLLRGAVTREHFHDLGKLIFGFVFFWGYIAFSQYMLIWYANMPEETQFYIPRQLGPWTAISITLIIFHLIIPFAGLMSRHVKRFMPALTFWLIWLLMAHVLDLFWLIMPNTYIRKIPEAVGLAPGTPLPDAFKQLLASHQSIYSLAESSAGFAKDLGAPLQPAALLTVIGLLVAMGGLYIANTARLLQGGLLVPVHDPRLQEALNFHNS